jgi:hypothetical protein
MHQLKEVDMLSAKMDLLMKRLNERAGEKNEVYPWKGLLPLDPWCLPPKGTYMFGTHVCAYSAQGLVRNGFRE